MTSIGGEGTGDTDTGSCFASFQVAQQRVALIATAWTLVYTVDYLSAVATHMIIVVSVLVRKFLIALGVMASRCLAMTMRVIHVRGHSVQTLVA